MGKTTAGRRGLRGRRIVLLIYVVVVVIAGGTGYLLGSIGPEGLRPVSVLGLIAFPPTPVGLALYGMATLGGGLGFAIVLIAFVSRRYA